MTSIIKDLEDLKRTLDIDLEKNPLRRIDKTIDLLVSQSGGDSRSINELRNIQSLLTYESDYLTPEQIKEVYRHRNNFNPPIEKPIKEMVATRRNYDLNHLKAELGKAQDYVNSVKSGKKKAGTGPISHVEEAMYSAKAWYAHDLAREIKEVLDQQEWIALPKPPIPEKPIKPPPKEIPKPEINESYKSHTPPKKAKPIKPSPMPIPEPEKNDQFDRMLASSEEMLKRIGVTSEFDPLWVSRISEKTNDEVDTTAMSIDELNASIRNRTNQYIPETPIEPPERYTFTPPKQEPLKVTLTNVPKPDYSRPPEPTDSTFIKSLRSMFKHLWAPFIAFAAYKYGPDMADYMNNLDQSALRAGIVAVGAASVASVSNKYYPGKYHALTILTALGMNASNIIDVSTAPGIPGLIGDAFGGILGGGMYRGLRNVVEYHMK